MIPEKGALSYDVRRFFLRLTPEFVRTSESVLSCTLNQLEEKDGKWIAAEGSALVSSGVTAQRLFLPEGGVFAAEGNALTAYPTGEEFLLPSVPRAVLSYDRFKEKRKFYAVTETGVYLLEGGTARQVGSSGGKCAAVLGERLYIASGNLLNYTAPLEPENWELSEDGGRIVLTENGGDIVALVPFGGRLYLFREHEILRLRADAGDLNFRFERVPFDGGTPVAGSAAETGGSVLFVTERGLFRFDGASFRLVYSPKEGESFTGTGAGGWNGKYYAGFSSGGSDCIFVYDTEAGAHLVRTAANALAAGRDGVYFLLGSRLLRLSGRKFPLYGTYESSLDCTFVLRRYGEPCFFEGITVGGSGEFRVGFSSEWGSADVYAKAGVRSPFPKVLRGGRVHLTVRSPSPESVIDEIVLHMREVKA